MNIELKELSIVHDSEETYPICSDCDQKKMGDFIQSTDGKNICTMCLSKRYIKALEWLEESAKVVAAAEQWNENPTNSALQHGLRYQLTAFKAFEKANQ